jgi:hypothetical protein
MDRINRINELFTEHCSITMPAGQYLTIYKEMQRLENELAWYKKEYESLKQKLEVK